MTFGRAVAGLSALDAASTAEAAALHDRLATTWEEYRGGEVPDLPGAEVDADKVMEHAKNLLRADENGDDFQRRYHRALQDSPEVVMVHAQWKRLGGVK